MEVTSCIPALLVKKLNANWAPVHLAAYMCPKPGHSTTFPAQLECVKALLGIRMQHPIQKFANIGCFCCSIMAACCERAGFVDVSKQGSTLWALKSGFLS